MSKKRFNNLVSDTLVSQTQLLKTLVDIKSVSIDGAANDKVQAIIKQQLDDLGFHSKLIRQEGRHRNPLGHLLVGEIAGQSKEFITLIGHSDTVNASDDFNHFSHESGAHFARGPGVIDCKGGLVIMLSAAKAFLQQVGKPFYSLRFVSSPSEETGSCQFQQHLHRYGQDTRFVLGFEPGFPNGNIVNARAGNRWYKLTIKGRSAHSGRNFTQGVNAIAALAIKLQKLHELSDIQKGSTVAITHIRGGNKNFNTIPADCEAYIDTRFLSKEEDLRLQQDIREVLRSVEITAYDDFKPAELSMEITDYTQPIEISHSHNHYLEHYLKAVEYFERKTINAQVSHGSADCNSLITDNNIFIGGLGAIGDGMHTIQEKIRLSSLNTRAEAAAQLLTYINHNNV